MLNGAFGNNQFGGASQITNKDSDLFSQYGLDRRGNNEMGTMFQRLGAFNFGPAASRASFNAGQEGNYQQALVQLLNRLRNQNYAAQGQRAGNRTVAQYGQGQQLADMSARASGLGQGAQLAGLQGLSQNAARSGAAAQESYLDPRRAMADQQQALQLLSQALQSNPYLEQMLAMFSPVEQRQAANAAQRQNSGLGGIAGNILGQYVGGGGFSQNRLKGGA